MTDLRAMAIAVLVLLACAIRLPAASADGPATIFVGPFAAGGDAGPPIRQAISQAIASGAGAQVVLREGEYHILTSADDNWHLVIGGARDLRVRGEGPRTQVIFRDPRKGGIFLPDCHNVRVSDLLVDYDPPPFTQGVIMAVNTETGAFDLRLDEAFPTLGEPWFSIKPGQAQFGVAIDAKERLLKSGVSDHFFVSEWRATDQNRVWTLQLADQERHKASSLAAGDRFVLMARTGNGAFRFNDSRDCTLENVVVHASPSLTVALAHCERMTTRGLSVLFRENSSRLIASNGDGVHCQQNRGGPLIEHCLFEGLCDDAINIYAPPLIVRRIVSPTQVAVSGHAHVRAGDTVQVFDSRHGQVRGEPTITSVSDEAAARILTFDRPVEGPVVAGDDHRSADTIYNLTASGSGYVIRHNHMRRHRRHGALLRAGDGVVEHNTFEQLGGHGVCVGNEPSWPEGPAPRNITIRRNRFIANANSGGYSDNRGNGAAIIARGLSLNGLAESTILSNIRVEENAFAPPPPNPAIWIGAARDVTVRDNRVEHDTSDVNVRLERVENSARSASDTRDSD